MAANYKDITGQRFGRLVAISYAGKGNRRRTYWNCKCDCGNLTRVQTAHLKSGHTTSCGCRLNELNSSIGKLNYKNGLSTSRLNSIYRNMLNRCYRKEVRSYPSYGGRGIKVCSEWLVENNGFSNFCEWAINNGYKSNLSLDRIDNNADYSPHNCRWVAAIEQANNKRNTHYLKINGEVDSVGNWARRLNVSYWNLLNYSKGAKNCKYPHLKIEAVQ